MVLGAKSAQAEAQGTVLRLRNERSADKQATYDPQWDLGLGLIVGLYWEGEAKLELSVAADGYESKSNDKAWGGARYREVTFAGKCPNSLTIALRNSSGGPLGNATLLCYPFDDGESHKQGEAAAVSCFGDRQDLWTVADTSLVTVRRIEGKPFEVLLWKRGEDELPVSEQETYELSPGPMLIEAGLTKAAVERAIAGQPSVVKYRITGQVRNGE